MRRTTLSVLFVLAATGSALAQQTAVTQDTGPIPPDLNVMAKEQACVDGMNTPGYYPSLNGAEVADSERSLVYPCASFLGTMDGKNDVYIWPSQDSYQGVLFINNRRPGELYLTGGNNPPAQGLVPPGPFVAKVNDTTGKEIWRNYLQNGNVTGDWVGAANLNILPDGNIVVAFGNHLVKLDGDSGLILKHLDLPATAPREGSNFKHLTIAPDGTLILKNQTRATPCNIQGTLAAFQCPGGVAASPGSTILAVDPDSFTIHDTIDVPENAVTPHVITEYDGRIAIYAPAIQKAYRFFWDPETKKLSKDDSWAVQYLDEGQTTGDAATIMGEWVVFQVNGLPATKAASSLTAIHRDDPSRITRVYPFGTELPTGMSWAPPKAAADPENSLIFSADQSMMKIGAVKLDQTSGEMTVLWTRDGATTALQGVYGPADARVLGTARAEPGTTLKELNQTSAPPYRQQAVWLNAMTGDVLAKSPFVEPMNFNTLLTPGYGGRFYYMHDKGFYVMQPRPSRD